MLKKLFIFGLNYIKNNWHQVWRYLIVGFVSAIIDFTILYVLTEQVGFHYLLSATISFIVAASLNYYLNKTWTFKASGSLVKQAGIFLLIAGNGVLLNNLIMYLLVEHVHLWYIYAKIIAVALVTVVNFLGNKYFTFRVK